MIKSSQVIQYKATLEYSSMRTRRVIQVSMCLQSTCVILKRPFHVSLLALLSPAITTPVVSPCGATQSGGGAEGRAGCAAAAQGQPQRAAAYHHGASAQNVCRDQRAAAVEGALTGI